MGFTACTKNGFENSVFKVGVSWFGMCEYGTEAPLTS